MKVSIFFLGLLHCLYAQELPRFSSDVQLVMADVQVTEKGTGQILELLGPKDFEIYDNGVKREVREFHFETTPFDVVFLTYGLSGLGTVKDINNFRKGFHVAAAELRPGDRAAVLRTNSEAKIDLEMSDDFEKVRRALIFGDRRYAPGHDRLYDAVKVATTLFPKPRDPSRRRAIVAVTDDIERDSEIKLDPLIVNLLEADVTLNEVVYIFGKQPAHRIGFGGARGIPRVGREVGGGIRSGDSLRPAVEATGGEAVPGDEFQERFPELMRRLRLRYLVGFYAESTVEREFHSIEIRLTPAARKLYPNALIRARRGYYTAPTRSTSNAPKG